MMVGRCPNSRYSTANLLLPNYGLFGVFNNKSSKKPPGYNCDCYLSVWKAQNMTTDIVHTA